ncbi:DUF6207 family protein [Streptomyces sp. NPDC101234]|uniref:DUF6207 family protein n=1 Tax=Streptomyces sp. NPDC101234 TaxID=3366138 RepID=UPI003810D3CD
MLADRWATAPAQRTTRDAGEPGVRLRCYLALRQPVGGLLPRGSLPPVELLQPRHHRCLQDHVLGHEDPPSDHERQRRTASPAHCRGAVPMPNMRAGKVTARGWSSPGRRGLDRRGLAIAPVMQQHTAAMVQRRHG